MSEIHVSTTTARVGLVSSLGQPSVPSLPVRHDHDSDDWIRKVNESQRNIGFSDRERNFGGFWGGLYRQKLNAVQSEGLLVRVMFYIVFFVSVVALEWPRGPEPFWQKIFYGYGPYLLLALPLFTIFPPTSLENATSEIELHDLSDRSLT